MSVLLITIDTYHRYMLRPCLCLMKYKISSMNVTWTIFICQPSSVRMYIYNHPKKVKLHGVIHKRRVGLPKCVIQDEIQNKTEQEMVWGVVCAAGLHGDHNCPSLLAISVYDTEPVHF